MFHLKGTPQQLKKLLSERLPKTNLYYIIRNITNQRIHIPTTQKLFNFPFTLHEDGPIFSLQTINSMCHREAQVIIEKVLNQ